MKKLLFILIPMLLFSGCCCSSDGLLPNVIDTEEQPIYGEMWNYTSQGYLFPIAFVDVYYNLTGLVAGELDGLSFTNNNQLGGGSVLTIPKDGLYKMDFSMSFVASQAGGQYGIAVVHNFDVDTHRNCYARRQGTGSVGNVGITCIMDIEAGDNVNIQVEQELAPPKDITIYTVNINLLRIDDLP